MTSPDPAAPATYRKEDLDEIRDLAQEILLRQEVQAASLRLLAHAIDKLARPPRAGDNPR